MIFQHQNRDRTSIRREKKQTAEHLHRFFENARKVKQLKKSSLDFASCNPFHPGHLPLELLVNSFSATSFPGLFRFELGRREKALASAGHVPILHPKILGVIN